MLYCSKCTKNKITACDRYRTSRRHSDFPWGDFLPYPELNRRYEDCSFDFNTIYQWF